jgi:hypothetical protein
MQRLITITLSDEHVRVEEHLKAEFEAGWRVVSMIPVSGGAKGITPYDCSGASEGSVSFGADSDISRYVVIGWVAVLLEKT